MLRHFRFTMSLLSSFRLLTPLEGSFCRSGNEKFRNERLRRGSEFFSNLLTGLTALIFAVFVASAVYADVCVWRNPERTMSRLFPKAKDYETIDQKISKEKLKLIEKRLGKPLDPGERENWSHYKIRESKGETLGYVLTDAEKGEYGVIEIVMGITPDVKVNGIYIQRAREKNKEFKAKEFLAQFVGKTKDNPIQIGKDIKATSSVPTEQVAFGVRKMLVMYDELKEATAKAATLEELLKNPKTYDGQDVVVSGIFNSICCPTDFVLKDGFNSIEVYITDQCPMPPKSKLRSKIQVSGIVKVKGDQVALVAKEIKFQ